MNNIFENKEISIMMVQGAYKKLKSYLYYDKTLPFAKKRLAILENNRESFNILVNFIKTNNPKREDTINKKYDYIMNNWKDIQRLYKYKMSCPMESQISHNIAALTSSRPKGYSHKMLKIILNLRLKYINKQNIKKLYLNNFNSNKIKNITVEHLNFDIFYRYKQFIPLYQGKLFTPNFIRYI